MRSFEKYVKEIKPASKDLYELCAIRQTKLTKPPGALGFLEAVACKFGSISAAFPPSVPVKPVVCVFAGDHGVLDEGISPWPQEVTLQMVANFLSGGAAINAIAKQVGATVVVIDIGVAGDTSGFKGLVSRKVRSGTGNLAREDAMSIEEVKDAIQVGVDVAASEISKGADLLVTGDMGIGNTTPSSALISWFAGEDIVNTTGRGTGIDDAMMSVKENAIRAAHQRLRESQVQDPVAVLGAIGGLEIAGLVGLIIGGCHAGVPIVLDGLIADSAAVVAHALNPNIVDYLFAGHRSTEPGAKVALEMLDLRPILDLDLRLGEGTGGCLSIPIIQAAVRSLVEMATFDEAGVSEN